MARETLASRLDPQRFPTAQRVTPAGSIKEALRAVEHYHLDAHDPGIGQLAQTLTTARHSAMRDNLASVLLARVGPFLEYHRDHPFVIAADGMLNGSITLGTQATNQARIGLAIHDINLHGTIVGPSGSGKTTVLHHLANGLLQEGMHLGVIDIKEDFGWLLRRPDALLIDETTPWNFLTTPEFLTDAEHREEVIDLLLTRFYGGAAQRAILDEGWQRAASKHTDFSIEDWINSIEDDGSPKERFSRADARQGAIARLRRFAQHKLFTTRAGGIPWTTLLTSTFVVRARGFDDVARFHFDLLARYAFLRNRSRHQTGLQLVLLVDESYDLMAAEHDGIRAIETLPRLKQLGREFGIGVITTTVTLNGLSDLARASTHFHVALPPNNQEEARAVIRVLGLNDAEATYFLRRMQRGEALLRIGTWPEVIHLQISPNTEGKHATPEDITNARRRTSQRATGPISSPTSSPPRPERITAASREEVQPHGPTPSHEPAPSSSPPARVAPAVGKAIAPNEGEPTFSLNTRKVAPNKGDSTLSLNPRERKILTYIAQRGILLVTELHAELHLHAMQESRTRKNLRALGLVEEHRIITRPGRGGTSTALMATRKAHDELHLTRAHLGKGGPAHRYYLRELRDHLGATLEVHETDAVLSYNNERHACLQHALGIPLNEGDTIAIEVEVTNPRVTSAAIAERNKHYTHTIIATLPQHLALARRLIAHNERVLVVDVLRLLDALRITGER